MLVVAGGLTLVVVILCFWVGGKLARSKGREVLPWSLVSALLPGIGLLVLAVQSSRNDIANLDTRAAGRGEQPARGVPLQPSYDERWRWLMLNDADIMAAIERLRVCGPSAQVLLRDMYLPAENKSALNQMVAQVVNQTYRAPGMAGHQQHAAAFGTVGANGAAHQSDLARYTMRQPAVGNAAPQLNGAGRPGGARPMHSPPAVMVPPVSFSPPLDPSFVNGQESGAIHAHAGAVSQGQPVGLQPGAAATPQARTTDPLASATAALASALRNAHVVAGSASGPPSEAVAVQPIEKPAAAVSRPVPHHTSVVAADLQGASFLETYRNIHLFALADGRVYVDKYLAVASVDLARQAVDYVATRNDT